MRKFITALLLIFSASYAQANKECVILLHGLARTESSMTALEKRLISEGYEVVNQGYKSRRDNIPSLSESAIPKALLNCKNSTSIHFVTHSMGGILVRYYLAKNTLPNLGKVVMLGPPNQGSEVVDKFKNWPGFKWMNGKAGLQLGTNAESIPMQLGPADFELGVIAGNRSISVIFSRVIPGPDDGKVAVERTKLKGMKDHLTLPVTHTFMMRNKKAIQYVLHFLKRGQFKPKT